MSSSPAASRPGGSGEDPRGPDSAASPVATVVAGRYRILGRIAEGGMGVVYKAEHTLSKKKLAIKLLHPHLCHGRQAVERFKREVSAAAEIDHPGIVQVFDAGVDTDGSFYMAMELLEGESLGQRTRRDWPGTRTAVAMIAEMCEPLARAHAKGFVHRDLKPDNVFLARDPETGRERLKLLDFGLAREVTQRRGPTMSGVTFGTPEYMSPEQCMSAKRAGIPSDVWSVGVMLYELLAGQHPFSGETANAVMANAIKEPLPPLLELAPHVPRELATIVERCLEKEPGKRPAHAGEVADLLRQLMSTVELDERRPVSPVLRSDDAGEDGDASEEIEKLRSAAAPPIGGVAIGGVALGGGAPGGAPLEVPRDARTSYVGPRKRAWVPWAIGGVSSVVIAVVVAIAMWPRGEASMVATELGAGAAAPTAPAPVAAPSVPVVAPVAPEPSALLATVEPSGSARDERSLAPEAAAPQGPAPSAAAPEASTEPAPEPSSSAGAARTRATLRAAREGTAAAPAEESESALEQAQACLARGDTRCAVAQLQDARSAPAMSLLVDVYRMQGRSGEARTVMQRYVQRFPRGAQTAEYQRELGLAGD